MKKALSILYKFCVVAIISLGALALLGYRPLSLPQYVVVGGALLVISFFCDKYRK